MPTYQELLESDEWKNYRVKILERDKYKCQNCNNNNFLNELEPALFDRFCFPNQNDIVSITSLKEESKIVRINPNFSNFLSQTKMIYYSIESNRIYGIRKMFKEEVVLVKKYIFKPSSELLYDPVRFNKCFEENFYNKLNSFRNLYPKLKYAEFDWDYVSGLHVHHKYYIINTLPWEYNEKALVTLCITCHENLHKNQKVLVYNKKMEPLGQYNYCKRCNGSGWFPEYYYVESGICFRCRGAKYEELIDN